MKKVGQIGKIISDIIPYKVKIVAIDKDDWLTIEILDNNNSWRHKVGDKFHFPSYLVEVINENI